MTHFARLAALALGAAFGLTHCNQSGGAPREWSAADHEGDARDTGAVRTPASGVPVDEDATLAEVAWRQSCATCHGMGGRGDAPQGQMLRAPDLTRPELARFSDDDLASVIRGGRNKMPAFEQLPPRVVTALVRHIRGLSGRR